eukprot:g1169.t1
MSVLESKHNTANITNFNYRGTGAVCLNDTIKERNTFRTRANISPVHESLTSDFSELSTSLFELDLGEDEEMLLESGEKSPVIKKLEALLEPLTTLEKQVSNDVKYLVLRHTNHQSSSFGSPCRNELDYDQSILAADLQSLGYDVNFRRSIGGGSGSEGVSNLNHTFIRCRNPDSNRVFIVDPKFKDQFDIAHKTNAYERVLEFVPKLLVLREDRVIPLVKLISQELAGSFRETGFPLPPWRKVDSLLSKWQPRKAMDTPLQKIVLNEGLGPMTGQSLPPFRGNGLTGHSRVDRGVPDYQEPVRIQAW